MEWIRHGTRTAYENRWMSVDLVDVEVPGGDRFDHHVLRGADAAGALVIDPDRGALLMWRHRFISDTWGWEVPAGALNPGEDPESAAARETLEETGWQPGPLTPLIRFHPVNGISKIAFHVYTATSATHIGDPSDPSESERIEWVPLDELRRIMIGGQMTDGFSLTACCYALALC